MDKEMKAKWVEALRSGKYKQAQGCLKKEGAYCCLGVACEISQAGKWLDDSYISGNEVVYKHLSEKVADILGCSPLGRLLDLNDRTGSTVYLVELNDDTNLTFAQIADVIDYFL